MKTTLLLGLWLQIITTHAAERVLAEYDWSKLAQSGQLLAGFVATVDAKAAALKLANTNDTALRVQFLQISNPPITKMLYALVGEVKYEGVRGDGYLEMWNYFPPVKPGMREGMFFSRTLGESGEMGKITGTSNWRRFMLPFDRTGTSLAPSRLEINLFLPAQGTVYVGLLKLVEYSGTFGSAKSGAQNPWWPDWAGGLIGGIGGALLGCLGCLLGWLAAKGRAQAFVLSTLKSLIALGVVSLATGFLAMALRQPYGVWFVPLLLGVLLVAILPSRLKQYRKLYTETEMRRMTAIDA
jgi:hypothetical protein